MTDIAFIRDQIGFYHGLYLAGEISFDLFLDIAGKLADDLLTAQREEAGRLRDLLTNAVPGLLQGYEMEEQHAIAHIAEALDCDHAMATELVQSARAKFSGLKIL